MSRTRKMGIRSVGEAKDEIATKHASRLGDRLDDSRCRSDNQREPGAQSTPGGL
jgi:hypothetical protein